jgi:hypothetical protein
MRKVLYFIVFIFCLSSYAQVVSQKVGNNPGAINSSAVLDVESTNKGFLPPRMTVINRNAIILPASGLMIYNTTSNALEINTGTPVSPVWIVTTNVDFTGDVNSSGSTTTVGKINGIAMSGLATGLLKNTTATGIPSIATIRTDYAEPTTALATGILKNNTGTGVHTIAVAADFPMLNQSTTGNSATVTTNANLTGDVTSLGNTTTVGKINGITMSGLTTGLLKNTTATGVPSIATIRTDYAEPTTALATGILKNTTGTGVHTIAIAADFPILNQSTTGNAATVTTNANLTGMVTSVGNASTVVTNANLTGEATSVGNAVTIDNAAVIGKTLTGYTSAAGMISATDNILQAIQKLDGNDAIPNAVTVFTSGGTYTPATGVKWITVECVGGGGAGGTTPSTTATNCAASGGGGGGGYRKVLITKAQLVGASFAVTIGLGGAVNLATGVGCTGGTSSLDAFVSCNGGVGGVASAAIANAVVSAGGAGGISTFSGSSSIIFLNGEKGETGYATTASTTRFFKGGNGGKSFLGFGGINNIAIASNASTSTFILPAQYGGGGAGVAHTAVNPLRLGQAGAPGVIVVTEFF